MTATYSIFTNLVLILFTQMSKLIRELISTLNI